MMMNYSQCQKLTVNYDNGSRRLVGIVISGICDCVCLCQCPQTKRKMASVNKKHLKNVGPIRHCEPFYIAIHQVSLLSHAACASMSTQQRQRMTEGTAMAPWNGPNTKLGSHILYSCVCCLYACRYDCLDFCLLLTLLLLLE